MDATCIIVEDQPPAQRVLEKYISDFGQLRLIKKFSDALAALAFLSHNKVDIVFLDVHLPKLSGMEFLKLLHPIHRPKVILTTAFSDYALEGYELDIIDYLLKPFSFERFIKAVVKAVSILEYEDNLPKVMDNIVADSELTNGNSVKHLFIKSGGEYLNFHLDSMRYIKSDGDYTMVYLTDRKHLVAHPLRYWLEVLPLHDFCQVHKSYIVAIQAISKVTGNQIHIGELKIPIGRTYKETFARHILNR